MGSEKNFEDRVKAFLEEDGCWFVKYWGGAAYTKSGIPDILASVHGRFFGIEVKAPTGRPKLIQLVKLEDIRKSGGFGILLYPKDFNEFKKLVQDIRIIDAYTDDWYVENIKKQEDWKKRLEGR